MMRTLSLALSALITATLTGPIGAPFASASGAPSAACDQLDGTMQAGNICHVHDETPDHFIDMRFGTDYPDAQPVADYLIQQRDQLLNAAAAPGPKDQQYQLSVTSINFSSGQPTRTTAEYGQPWHGTQSLVVQVYEYAGGAGGTHYKTFNFDYDQNRPVTFDNLFAPGSDPMDALYPLVATDLARQQIARNFHLSPQVGRDPAHYQKFAITDDALVFYFDTSEFMAEEAGYYFVYVPRAKLPPLQL